MNADGQKILACLQAVAAHRAVLAGDPARAARMRAVKAYQHSRFAATYADLLARPRYGRATQFFLDELYGPRDFTERDVQFARIVPALVRLFPVEIVGTVAALAELHALSEELDSLMAAAMPSAELDAAQYAQAWRTVGRPMDRQAQIGLMLDVGYALDRFTRKPLLGHSLRLMRGPASAGGLSTLQHFLETGFDSFKAMQGAQGLLDTVAQREAQLAAALFAGGRAQP